MSSELLVESDSAMVIMMNVESFGVDGAGYDETETEPPSSTKLSDKPAVKIMFQVTEIVRFLLERGLRFRNLGFCGHDLM
jgi:hypothetical protein